MVNRNRMLAAAVAATLGTLPMHAGAAEPGEIKWFGSVYAKFLDGNRNINNALYNNAETTPGEAGGDQGQGIEFELMFNAQVSKQVELGGRIKARFNQNFWANFGGFGPQEEDERSAQYMKLRGAWARITPGYEWIDSATIGSNDWGMFDAFTQGKFRYIDRDNSSGVLLQGSAFGRDLRWDLARVSLSRLFQGPAYNTGELFANDAAWIGQFTYSPSPDWNFTGIYEWINDDEVDPADDNVFDGTDTVARYDNKIFGLKGQYSGLGFMDIRAAYYGSDFTIADDVCGTGLGDCRYSPTPKKDTDGEAYTINLEFNDLGIDGLTVAAQYFHIGADYVSVTAARRESDVLLTEGQEGTWQQGRPEFNCFYRDLLDTSGSPVCGNRDSEAYNGSLGWGGWNGEVQQVVAAGLADNDFTDFDEPVAHTVVGWKGFTIVPKYRIGDWEFAAEYSNISFDTNWQACGLTDANGNPDKDAGCIYPLMEGTNSWGLGGAYRSPYSLYQDRSMEIYAIRADYFLDIGNGVDLSFRYKYIKDEDKRVTTQEGLVDAYDGYGGSVNQDWIPNLGLGGCLECDDRSGDYNTYGISAGYQIHPDLYLKLIYELNTVDLIDGTIDVAPIGLGRGGSWINYLTGEHEKNRVGLNFSYFLSGVEFGGTFDWFWGEYRPEFYTNDGESFVRLVPAEGVTVIPTALANIPIDKVKYDQYRMKVFMKVSF